MGQNDIDKVINDDAHIVVNNEQKLKKQFLINMFKIISKHDVMFEMDKSIQEFKEMGYTMDEAKQEVRNKYRQVLCQNNDIAKTIRQNSGESIYNFHILFDNTVIKESEADKIEEYQRLHIECIADIFCKYDFTVVDDEIIAGKKIVREIREVYIAHEIVQSLNRERERATTKAPSTPIIIPSDILAALKQEGFIEIITADSLKWLKSKSLLAYFVEVANDKLNLRYGEKRQIKPFETMFKVTGLTGSINDYKKTGQLPIGYEIIDKIF